MTISTQYAKALYELVARLPLRGTSGQDKNDKEGGQFDKLTASKYLKNLRQALERRGHIKLLPQIFSEYKKLALANERAELHKKITPEGERTKMLLELYRKLTTNSER